MHFASRVSVARIKASSPDLGKDWDRIARIHVLSLSYNPPGAYTAPSSSATY